MSCSWFVASAMKNTLTTRLRCHLHSAIKPPGGRCVPRLRSGMRSRCILPPACGCTRRRAVSSRRNELQDTLDGLIPPLQHTLQRSERRCFKPLLMLVCALPALPVSCSVHAAFHVQLPCPKATCDVLCNVDPATMLKPCALTDAARHGRSTPPLANHHAPVPH